MPPITPLRKVMTKREARTIRRLKTVVKMLITELAKVTKRHKMIIYSVIKGDAKLAKRGPKEKRCLGGSTWFWLHLVAPGYFWLFLGCFWLLLVAPGCSWLLLAALG